MGLRARATVEARFSEQEMVNRYERMLLELAGAEVHPPAAATHGTKVTR
jgi:hypothetical protein